MATIERQTDSVAATARLAGDLAAVLRPGDVVRLDGPMGAGKTTLVRLLAEARGIDPALVSSPTYVIVNEYPGGYGPDLIHVDCYRLGDEDELDALGWDRLLGEGHVVLIEWGERIERALPGDAARITIEPTGQTERTFLLDLPDAWSERAGYAGLEARADTVCPVTGRRVAGDSPTWPFASERARMADLYRWMSEQHVISRPLEQRDLEEGVD